MSRKLSEIPIYRMTHIDNVPHIMRHGITHRTSPNANPDFRVIGDVSHISARDETVVRVDNGDLFLKNASTIRLGDFIPFYFGVRMPMLRRMQLGNPPVTAKTPAEQIIYIACNLDKVIAGQRSYYFTDGHGSDRYTTFYDRSMVNNISDVIDLAAIKAKYWGGEENLDIKRKKQAEFLASEDVGIECIIGMACYNEAAKQKLVGMGVDEQTIKVKPALYY